MQNSVGARSASDHVDLERAGNLLHSVQSAMRPQDRIVIPNRVIRLSRPRHFPKHFPVSSLDGKRPFQYGPLTAKQRRLLMTGPKPTPPGSKKTSDAHIFKIRVNSCSFVAQTVSP